MTRALAACLFVVAGTTAFADEVHVRTTTSVEVLDDKANLDQLIARLRKEPVTPTDNLKQERPPPPPATSAKRSPGPEQKQQPPGTRRPARDRSGNPEQTERPRPRRQ
jgi:hypothetical protein